MVNGVDTLGRNFNGFSADEFKDVNIKRHIVNDRVSMYEQLGKSENIDSKKIYKTEDEDNYHYFIDTDRNFKEHLKSFSQLKKDKKSQVGATGGLSAIGLVSFLAVELSNPIVNIPVTVGVGVIGLGVLYITYKRMSRKEKDKFFDDFLQGLNQKIADRVHNKETIVGFMNNGTIDKELFLSKVKCNLAFFDYKNKSKIKKNHKKFVQISLPKVTTVNNIHSEFKNFTSKKQVEEKHVFTEIKDSNIVAKFGDYEVEIKI